VHHAPIRGVSEREEEEERGGDLEPQKQLLIVGYETERGKKEKNARLKASLSQTKKNTRASAAVERGKGGSVSDVTRACSMSGSHKTRARRKKKKKHRESGTWRGKRKKKTRVAD